MSKPSSKWDIYRNLYSQSMAGLARCRLWLDVKLNSDAQGVKSNFWIDHQASKLLCLTEELEGGSLEAKSWLLKRGVWLTTSCPIFCNNGCRRVCNWKSPPLFSTEVKSKKVAETTIKSGVSTSCCSVIKKLLKVVEGCLDYWFSSNKCMYWFCK